jgi:hypothetical protein
VEISGGDSRNLGDEFAEFSLVLEEVVEVVGFCDAFAMGELQANGPVVLRLLPG